MNLVKPLFAGFDAGAVLEKLPPREERFNDSFARVLPKILSRPDDERFEFFRAIANGLRPPREKEERKLSLPQEKQRRTLTVYGVSLMNWQTIDCLRSSKEAFAFLQRLLPVEIIGHDAERIRRMFARLGKQFRPPGRPMDNFWFFPGSATMAPEHRERRTSTSWTSPARIGCS